MSVFNVIGAGSGALFGSTARSIKTMIALPFSVAEKVIYFPFNIFIKSALAKKLSALMKDGDALNHLEAESFKLLEKHNDIPRVQRELILGNRRSAAEFIAPQRKYPHLYRDMPEDLRRSVLEDGRICNGSDPAPALAGVAITPEFVEQSWRDATKVSMRVAYLSILLFLFASVFTFYSAAFAVGYVKEGSVTRAAENLPGVALPSFGGTSSEVSERAQSMFVAKNYADVFDDAAAEKIFSEVHKSSGIAASAKETEKTASTAVKAIIFFILFMLCGLVSSAGIARMFWIARFRGLVRESANASVAPFRFHMREALQRWRWRIPERDMLLSAYDDQLKFANEIDKSPLIELGVATGLLEHRGHLLAPIHGATVKMSIVDLLQHVEVLGGSGEGKSRNVYVPVVRQLIALRKQGYPISIYATDDKGAIGQDIIDACREAELDEKQVISIGTSPGDYRVDLCAGMTPAELGDVIRSIVNQTGGSSKDDFWPEMASDILTQCGVVMRAFESTAEGQGWHLKHGMRPYSIMNLLRVSSSEQLIAEYISKVSDAIQTEYDAFDEDDMPQMISAMALLTDMYLPMVDATKDGIRANMRKALKSFGAHPALAEGFATGCSDRIVPPSVLLDPRIKVINVSQIEYGSAGRIVAVMLKTLLFKQARIAELRDPSAAKARLKWWFNPDLTDPNIEKRAITIFLADEYQGLVTASMGDGMSDATAWNVLRSAGIGGILLSQSVSAFKMAVGAEAAENMRRNWRTKIYLRTEDLTTIEEAKKLAGKTMRFYSLNNSLVESAASAKREFEVSADDIKPVKWNDSLSKLPATFNMTNASEDFRFEGFKEPYEMDRRFISNLGWTFLMTEKMGDTSVQQAYWRQEDKISAALQNGIVDVDAVRDEDIMEMGRGRAMVYIQRSGGTRVDVIKLND